MIWMDCDGLSVHEYYKYSSQNDNIIVISIFTALFRYYRERAFS